MSIHNASIQWKKQTRHHILHDHPYYRVNPDILSLVGNALPGNECGSPNYTCI